MENFLILLLLSLIVFLIYKSLLVLVSTILHKLFKLKNSTEFDLGLSIAVQLLFLGSWVVGMDTVSQRYGMSDIYFYMSFCAIGVFCVIWCYFSWDIDHIFVMPHKANSKHKRIKKTIIYILVLIFVLVQGYYQTLHAIDSRVEIDILFSVTNYSVIVAVIALDRVLNQILS